MIAVRLVVERNWTAVPGDREGDVALHRGRAELLQALVGDLGLNVVDWGETFDDDPHEEVTVELTATGDPEVEALFRQAGAWVRTGALHDVRITVGGRPEISVRRMGRTRGAPPPVSPGRGVGGGATFGDRGARTRGGPRMAEDETPAMSNGGDEPPEMTDGRGAGDGPPEMIDGRGPGDEPPAMKNGGDEPPQMTDGRGAADELPTMSNGGGGEEAPEATGDEPPASEVAGTPPRFTVVDVFETETEELASTRKLSSDEPLEIGRWYALDVSIGVAPAGIESEGEIRSIEEPMEEGDAHIAVLATSADFEIDEPVRTLTLPPSGPSSDHAVFHIRAPAALDEPAEVRIHLLYRLNLIEDIVLVARVATPGGVQPAEGSLRVRHAPFQQFGGLNTLPPKQMHIHVSKRAEQFVFFLVLEVENERVVFNGRTPARLTEDTLASLLEATRRALLRIALTHKSSSASDPPGSRATDPNDARELAAAGRKLWTTMFRSARGTAMFEIGEWLANRSMETGALIQVTVDESAGTFVFPWGLLYDRPLPDGPFDPIDRDAFWGLRYVIEQHVPPIRHRDVVEPDFRPSPRTTIDAADGITGTLLLGNFVEARGQEAFFNSLQGAGAVSLAAGKAVRSRREALELLGQSSSDVLCFFTHGHSARPLSSARIGVDPNDFLKLYEAIPKETLDPSWFGPYERVKAGLLTDDESWIELESGRITTDDFVELPSEFERSPVVLLNMCESVQLIPSVTTGLVDVFIGMRAMSVIGTETSVPPRFAHHFGVEFLRRFLGGTPVGTALLEVRQAYAAADDLFGLAYGLYGSGRVRVEPPLNADELDAAVKAALGAVSDTTGGDT